MSTVMVNGAARELDAGTTVGSVVADLSADPSGCAVAVNDEVLPRARWSETTLQPGDRVEILTAVQGG